MKMIGVFFERLRSRIMLAVVKPSMPGICTSIRIAAKSSSSTRFNASSPEAAVTMRAPSGLRISSTARRLAASSSTIRMLAWRKSSSPPMAASPRQHEQRIAAERARGDVGPDPEKHLPRSPQQLRLPADVRQLGAARRVTPVQHFVAGILERGERGPLVEVMDVAHAAARVEQRPPAQQRQGRQVERDVEHLEARLPAQAPQEIEI